MRRLDVLLGKRKPDLEEEMASGSENPTSVLYDRNSGCLTHCKLHSRDFSDCLKYHVKQHPFWDVIRSGVSSQPARTVPYTVPREKRKEKAISHQVRQISTQYHNKEQENVAALPVVARDHGLKCEDSASTEDQQEDGMDPLKVLGLDIMRLVLVRLDARSLARSGVTCREWRSLAHCDALWVSKIGSSSGCDSPKNCEHLWTGKRHLPAAALLPGLSKVAAYGISMKDSRRCFITVEDLCQHAWEFHFKDTVPDYWLDLDPSRRGEPPMRRFFHSDASQTAEPGDPVWGGHESSFCIIRETVAKLGQETFVRINHWPKMVISRTEDWGWEMNNGFYVYRSLPDSCLPGGTGLR